jgi:hypothetical protein
LALCLGLGCDTIAGIQEGQLAAGDSGTAADATTDGGAGDGTSPNDAAAGDSTTPPRDSSSTVDAPSDAPFDAPPDATLDAPPDAPPDAPSVPVVCTVNAGSVLMLDDLSVNSANGLEFSSQELWLAPLPSTNDSVFVLTQAGQVDIAVYQVSFGQGSSTRVSMGASATGNVRLLDVEPAQGGYVALSSLGTSVQGESALRVIGPLNSFQSAPTPVPISPTVMDGGAFPNGAALVSPQAGLYYWLLAVQNQTTNSSALLSGSSASGGIFESLGLQQDNNSGVGSIFDLAGNLYGVASGIGDAGGSTLLVYPDTLANPGTQVPVETNVPNVDLSTVLTAHVSAADPTKAALLAATLDNSGNAQIWSGLFTPAQMHSLTIGSPQFTAGSQLAFASGPFGNGSTTPAGDQAFLAGPPQGGGTDVLLLWVGAEGRVIASGPLVNRSNPIRMARVCAGNIVIGEVDADLFVAWVERITPTTGSPYDQLWGARATCQPAMGD